MAIQIPKNSWLNMANLLIARDDSVDDDVTFWDLPDFPPLIPQDDDVFFTIDSSRVGRLDLIANDFYSDKDLWWVIALANGIDLIPSEVTLNKRLRIPSKTYVLSYIAKGGNK